VTAETALYGGIEGGGTKFVCAVGRSPVHIVDSVSIATTDADSTLAECVRFFGEAAKRHGAIATLGFGCCGPIELRQSSPDFARMLPTPKPGWSGVDVLAPFRSSFRVPIALDTDVSAAALAEWRLGAGRRLGSIAYITVGTGIGGAVAPAVDVSGRLMHAEMGHLPIERDPRDGDFVGICPFHGDCLEGLASGPAIRARWGCALEALPPEHAGRSIIAGYLGQMVASIALMLSVQRVVFGGGVMSDGTLLPLMRAAAFRYLNGYIPALKDYDRMTEYVCAPLLGNQAGIAGALLLAETEHRRGNS
jgi:fructokinase